MISNGINAPYATEFRQIECASERGDSGAIRHTVRRRARVQKTINPLFPRYLFIRLQLERDSIAPLRSTRGVVHLVRFDNCLRALPDGFVEGLNAQGRDGAHLQQSLASARGDLVEVLCWPSSGALASFDIESGGGRARLLLNLLGHSHQLRVARSQIGPVA